MRNGLDIAKAIAMGASLTASAWPFLRPASVSAEQVKKKMEEFVYGLKSVMFLTGCKNIKELSQLKYIVTGELRQWCNLD